MIQCCRRSVNFRFADAVSLRCRRYLRDQWIRTKADETVAPVMLAIYPASYASVSTWEGLFDQLYTAHPTVWELSQNVTNEMFQAGFEALEAEASATFLLGQSYAEVYAKGESDPSFMSTDRLLQLASVRAADAEAAAGQSRKERRKEKARLDLFDIDKPDDEDAADDARCTVASGLITAAELRGWLFHKLGVGAIFGGAGGVESAGCEDASASAFIAHPPGTANTAAAAAAEAEATGNWLIANREVQRFGDCFASFDITPILNPDVGIGSKSMV